MKKDKKKPGDEMSNKKRLQDLVWDGLFNSLDNPSKEVNAPKKTKKSDQDKKGKDAVEKSDDDDPGAPPPKF